MQTINKQKNAYIIKYIMVYFLLIILCLNIDALSYGIAYGSKNIKLPKKYIFFITTLSTIMFSISLYISKFVYQYLNKSILSIINGIILIILGCSYIKPSKKTHLSKKNFSFKVCLFECLAISIDAIFTTLLSIINYQYSVIYIIFYALTNYFAIFFGNLTLYKIGKYSKFSINFFSFLIFVILGILKIFGI